MTVGRVLRNKTHTHTTESIRTREASEQPYVSHVVPSLYAKSQSRSLDVPSWFLIFPYFQFLICFCHILRYLSEQEISLWKCVKSLNAFGDVLEFSRETTLIMCACVWREGKTEKERFIVRNLLMRLWSLTSDKSQGLSWPARKPALAPGKSQCSCQSLKAGENLMS